jgi:hypothetical protein
MRSPASGTWITSLGGGSNVHLSRERRDGSPFDSPAWPALPIWTRSRSLVSRAGLASRGDANNGRVPLRSPAWSALLTSLDGLDLTEQPQRLPPFLLGAVSGSR